MMGLLWNNAIVFVLGLERLVNGRARIVTQYGKIITFRALRARRMSWLVLLVCSTITVLHYLILCPFLHVLFSER